LNFAAKIIITPQILSAKCVNVVKHYILGVLNFLGFLEYSLKSSMVHVIEKIFLMRNPLYPWQQSLRKLFTVPGPFQKIRFFACVNSNSPTQFLTIGLTLSFPEKT